MSDSPARTVTASVGAQGYAVDVGVGPFSLRADEPVERHGSDTGPTPHQFVAAGLASCTAMTLRMYADRHALPLAGVRVEVQERRSGDPARGPIAFDVSVALDGPLEPAARERLMEIAGRCPVHLTLSKGTSITLTAVPGVEDSAPPSEADAQAAGVA